jgi:choline dehydrogenase-like flavoprotein
MLINSVDWRSIDIPENPVVIIGSGAAGISLALKLEKLKIPCLVLEAGGEDYSEESQACYSGTMLGGYELPNGLTGLRQRFFGGSTNCWAGGCAEFNSEDFLTRDWIPLSGWPYDKSALNNYYEEAAELLGVNINFIRDPEHLRKLPKLNGFETNSLEFCSNIQFSYHFGEQLHNSKLIKLFLDATLVDINCLGKKIVSVTISDSNNNLKKIFGGHFVLATGGIENARILLNARVKNPNDKYLKNENIGKYFSEHPIGPCATLLNASGKVLSLPYESSQYMTNGVLPYYRSPFALQKKYKTLNFSIQIIAQEDEFSEVDLAALRLYRKLAGTSNKSLNFDDYVKILMNPIDVWKKYSAKKSGLGQRLALRFQLEQAPNPESKITLIEEKDQYQNHLINLSWNFSDLEKKTIEVALAHTAQAMWSIGAGTLKVDHELLKDKFLMPGDLRGGGHHCGTTRMAKSSKNGVTDSNQKVFDTDNLYVVGSSVFPTNGWANPTFTIIATTLKVADVISKEVKIARLQQ